MTWIQTFSGIAFDYSNITLDSIQLIDISHALANFCRYNGHCREFYCPTPDQRVLTADLRWLPAGDLKVGDELLGFDEQAVEVGSCGKNRRRFRHARVLTAMPVRRKIIRLEMADGSTVRSSEEHPWLAATKLSHNQKWLTAQEIAKAVVDGRKRYMHRFVEPWGFSASREAGWLAGLYDGEGYLSAENRKGTQLGVSQRPGAVLNHAIEQLKALGFDSLAYAQTGDRDVISVQMRGGWREILRLLGSVRPIRLLDKFVDFLRSGAFSKQMSGIEDPTEIVGVYFEGESWCSGLETSTRTYLCEGFGAHNSVAQHSNICSFQSTERLIQQCCLMHDAQEAYIGDMVRPLKQLPDLKPYRDRERDLEHLIAKKFNLPFPMPEIVHEIDMRVLATEAQQLFSRPPRPWHVPDAYPGLTIKPQAPGLAEASFLERFHELFN